MKNSEPKFCPGCPLRRWLPQVKRESWCNIPNNASAVQLCARLRALSQEDPTLPKCPHYPKNETLTIYFPKRFTLRYGYYTCLKCGQQFRTHEEWDNHTCPNECVAAHFLRQNKNNRGSRAFSFFGV